MPYPVSPPALPPVVNVVLPEESHSSSSSNSTDSPFTETSVPPTQTNLAAPVCSDCGSVVPALEASLSITSDVVSAEGLGGPVTLGTSSGLSSSDVVQPVAAPRTASWPLTSPASVLPLPDLDVLVQSQKQSTFQPGASPNAASLALDNQASNNSATATPERLEPPIRAESEILEAQIRPEPTAIPQPAQQPETIRLDLPTPAPEPSPNQQSDPQLQPEETSNPPAPELPAPVPDPTGGEVLTIPTPPRTRQDSETDTEPNEPATPGPGPDETAVPIDPEAVGEVLEVRADRQEFDERQQIFRADGNVTVRFRQGVLTADRVRVNIPNRVAVAEGDAALTRGNQVLRGARFSYNFGLNQGSIQTARGELLIPAAERDLAPEPPTEVGSSVPGQPVAQPGSPDQPLQVFGGLPGPSIGFNNRSQQQGQINRLRFEADQAEFMGDSLVAQNVRITNDPFSPPELELRSSRVTYNRLSPTSAEIRARNPRLVFDQGFELPLLVNRLVLDERRRDSGLLNFGFDERDRDGFFVERTFDIYSSPLFSFSLTPQVLVQRAIDQGGFPDPDHFGLVAELDFRFTPDTTVRAIANFSSLDFDEIEDRLRASVRAQQRVFNHTASLEYSYRNRLFNGSLGFQDVQSSIGLVVTSPRYVLGDSLINLTYQGSIQYVNAQTDQNDLYPLLREDRDLSCINPDDRDTTGNGCADLTRYQAAATLSRFFPLWYGTPLPPTPTEGLRYTPTPVVPYLGVFTQVQGVYSGYSNGDHQASLRGSVSLLGQFGRHSRPFLDFTGFSFGYYNTLLDGKSPFLFDRVGDEQFVIARVIQQIYGPLLAGVQIAYNLDTQDEIDTVYTLEYRRRTYSIIASYSTGRESAELSFQLNDFNWTGDPGPFSGLGSDTVDGGVIQGNN